MAVAAKVALGIWLIAGLVACSPPGASESAQPAPTATVAGNELTGDQQTDRAALARVEQDVRALAKADGCSESGQCRAVPVGAKACGGPRYWLPYCPLTTDSAALLKRAEELRALEDEFNRKYGVLSDCAYVGEPTIASAGGACQAQSRSPLGP